MFDKRRPGTARWVLRRRSQRLERNVSVVVYRPPKEGQQFYEKTQTLVVSAHGALMTLAASVALNQRLIVQNIDTGEQQECRVVYVGRMLTGPTQAAVEFMQPAPSFWRIPDRPADWTANA